MRWFAVLDTDGKPVSVGTVLADPLPKGLTAVEVDGPAEGRPWDAQAKAWGPKPEPPVIEPAKEIDREKAMMQNVPVPNIFESLQVYLGSLYVNDFNRFGRTYQVVAQAEAPFRDDAADVTRIKTRNAKGEMVPVASLAFQSTHPVRGGTTDRGQEPIPV